MSRRSPKGILEEGSKDSIICILSWLGSRILLGWEWSVWLRPASWSLDICIIRTLKIALNEILMCYSYSDEGCTQGGGADDCRTLAAYSSTAPSRVPNP